MNQLPGDLFDAEAAYQRGCALPGLVHDGGGDGSGRSRDAAPERVSVERGGDNRGDSSGKKLTTRKALVA